MKKAKCKSDLLEDIEKLIADYATSVIHVRRKQFKKLHQELFPHSRDDLDEKSRFEHLGRVIQVWPLDSVEGSQSGY